MKELEPLLNLDVMTVTGKTLREKLQTGRYREKNLGLAVAYLSPEGAYVF